MFRVPYFLCIFVLGAVAIVPEDEVRFVPNFELGPDSVPFRHFSGYFPVTGSLNQKQIHYWFIESRNDPATDPLVFWLTGGPGCSGMFSSMRESGPLQFDTSNRTDSTVYLNPYSFNQIANVLYIDQPTGVGFSFSPNASDYLSGDTQSALDNYEVLQRFFVSFPEYSRHEFFLTGSSYGGIFVPALAEEIRKHNELNDRPFINLKGLLIGNGVTYPQADSVYQAIYPFYKGHGVISDDTLRNLQFCENGANIGHPSCVQGMREVDIATDGLNPYDIYDNCGQTLPSDYKSLTVPRWKLDLLKGDLLCYDTTQQNRYLRELEVMAAFHVNPAISWSVCSDTLTYDRDLNGDSYHFYPDLLRSYRIWVFYGDADGVVPYNGGEIWTSLLSSQIGLTRSDDWRPWKLPDNNMIPQTAGMWRSWNTGLSASGFSFVTVKGGSHSVPESHPRAALELLKAFLVDEPL